MAKGPAQRGDGGQSATSKDDNRASGMGDGGGGYSPGVSGKAPARAGGIADITQARAQSSGVNKAATDGMIAAMAAMAPRQPTLAGSMATPANAYVPSPPAPAAGGFQTLQDLLSSPGFRLDPEGMLDAMPQGQLRSEAERYLSNAPDLGYAVAPDIQGTAAGMYGTPTPPTAIAGTRSIMGSGMNPANAYVPTPTPPTASMGGFPHAQGISGVNDPYAYSNMPGRTPGAEGQAPNMAPPAGLQQGSGFAPSSLPTVGMQAAQPTAQQPMTPQQVYGGLASSIGFPTEGYGPFPGTRTSTSPATPATPAPQPAAQPSAPGTNMANIAQETSTSAGNVPIEYSAGVIPSSATMPGLGLMSGIQQGIGSIRDLLSGDRQIFGEGGMFPADSRDPETRASDWFAAQAEMDRGGDTPFLFGPSEESEELPAETPQPVTPYIPDIPPPSYGPYQQPTGGTVPYYGSYADLVRAVSGMAQGGTVQAGMNNAFAPGSYYARYNPHMRGLGGLRRG